MTTIRTILLIAAIAGVGKQANAESTPDRYIIEADIVTDTRTGLIWQRGVPAGYMTWENALTYCGSLTLAGHSDWRLPSVRELRSLDDNSVGGGSLVAHVDPIAFPNTPPSAFWTLSVYAPDANSAWLVNVTRCAGMDLKTSRYMVRCVR